MPLFYSFMKNLDSYLFDAALLDMANHRFEEENRLSFSLFKRILNVLDNFQKTYLIKKNLY